MKTGIERLSLGNQEIDLRWRVNRQAKRVMLRVDPARGDIVLVLPSTRSRAAGLRFAVSKADWISAQVQSLPPRVPFVDGVSLPILGECLRVRHDPNLGIRPLRGTGELRIGGAPEQFGKRLAAWLRQEARRIITPRAAAFARRLDREIGRISIRDPRTRWASCADDGSFSFSWRLILAPEHVLDYVVAHEAAHLIEMNHSVDFWALVQRLRPNHEPAQQWLRVHGQDLHRYG